MEQNTRNRWALGVLFGLLLFAPLRALVATRRDAFTIDEPWHIVAGVSHLRNGDYRLNPEQPPFVKLVAAMVARDLRLPPLPQLTGKSDERRFIDNTMFLGNDADAIQRRVRVAMTLMNTLLLALLAVAIWRTLGPVVAAGALAFLAIDPSVAANIPVVMTDLPIALAGTAAALFTVAALVRRSGVDLALAILSFAIAVGSKHSGPIVAVALVLIAAVVIVRTRTEPRLRFAIGATVMLFAGAWILLWAQYRFHFLEAGSVADSTNTALSQKIGDVRSPTMRSGLKIATAMRIVPRPYIWGLADTIRAGAEGRGIPVFLFGTTYRDRGPLYHWPAIIAAKLPLGLTALIVIGIIVLIRYGIAAEWRLPAGALAILSALFLFFLMRGSAYAGIRHALPLFPPLAVLAGASFTAIRSRLTAAAVTMALLAAAVSAVPTIRPWEYYNEAFGGPAGAYRHFNDEGIDVGQRTKDLALYCKSRLEPRGVRPYVFYALSPQEERSRHLNIHSSRAADVEDNDDPVITGTFLVHAKAIMRNPELRALRDVAPSDRIGNLLVYNGTYRLPGLRIDPLRRKADQLLRSKTPDFARAEKYLRRLVRLDPNQSGAYIHLGNIDLSRHAAEEAIADYGAAVNTARDDMKPAIRRQIDLLGRADWASLKPIKVPERE